MVSVWPELLRRNVIKVAIAYAAVAWLLAQSILVDQPLNLPEWTDTFVIVFLAVGFCVALIDACQPLTETDFVCS